MTALVEYKEVCGSGVQGFEPVVVRAERLIGQVMGAMVRTWTFTLSMMRSCRRQHDVPTEKHFPLCCMEIRQAGLRVRAEGIEIQTNMV